MGGSRIGFVTFHDFDCSPLIYGYSGFTFNWSLVFLEAWDDLTRN